MNENPSVAAPPAAPPALPPALPAPSSAPPPLTPRRCRHTGYWIVIILLALGLGMSLVAHLGLSVGRALNSLRAAETGGKDEFPRFTETWSFGGGETKVVRIALDGIIMREADGGFFFMGPDKVEHVLRQVQAASQDEEVRAIILEVNSPGGAVTPSDEIHAALRAFRESRADRRVLAFVRDLAASGGYYVAAAADRIVSEPTALVGSIGVIMEALNWNTLTDKIGVDATTIKSGRNKDLLNPFEPVNPEHVQILQALVDDAYARFRDLVAKSRGFAAEKAAAIADGRVFPASRAREEGLIDAIGYWEAAVEETARLLGEEEIKVVRYESAGTFLDKLLAVRAPTLRSLVPAAQGPRLMYLWRP